LVENKLRELFQMIANGKPNQVKQKYETQKLIVT
jgi:hypothetical protein